ncbi:hypothetical protein HN51_036434, partial [Arachis hypogaea]
DLIGGRLVPVEGVESPLYALEINPEKSMEEFQAASQKLGDGVGVKSLVQSTGLGMIADQVVKHEGWEQLYGGLMPSLVGTAASQEWPLRSELDPGKYGPQELAITSEIINKEIRGILTVEKSNEEKLFILDYHDILLPYVSKVRKLKGKTLYGSRTLFFLTPEGTLKPLAIELTRPPMDGKKQWKQVFTPSWHSTSVWL